MTAFVKYHGAGNDFILIDDREEEFPTSDEAFIQQLCDRCSGIGADGLILLQNSDRADFRMRIFNSDGKEAPMCGNGLRCLCAFIRDEGFLIASACHIEVGGEIRACFIQENSIATAFEPKILFWELPIGDWTAYVINTGVPHAVIFVPDIERVDVEEVGPQIRHHALFHPEGVNATFAQVLSPSQISVRTFERGVEAETLACGTGAAAAAFAAAKLHGLSFPIDVIPRSQEQMTASWDSSQGLILSGPATRVFNGTLEIPIKVDESF